MLAATPVLARTLVLAGSQTAVEGVAARPLLAQHLLQCSSAPASPRCGSAAVPSVDEAGRHWGSPRRSCLAAGGTGRIPGAAPASVYHVLAGKRLLSAGVGRGEEEERGGNRRRKDRKKRDRFCAFCGAIGKLGKPCLISASRPDSRWPSSTGPARLEGARRRRRGLRLTWGVVFIAVPSQQPASTGTTVAQARRPPGPQAPRAPRAPGLRLQARVSTTSTAFPPYYCIPTALHSSQTKTAASSSQPAPVPLSNL